MLESIVGPDTREPNYIATGSRGHLLMVRPYLDLVIARQVATVDGVGIETQIERATEGSPEVTDEQIEKPFEAIILAHPERRSAFEV